MVKQNVKTTKAVVGSIVRAERGIVSESVENFRRLMQSNGSPTEVERFSDFQQLVADKITVCFTYEEEQLFPLVRADVTDEVATKLIDELHDEHTSLLREAREVSELLRSRPFGTSKNDLWRQTVHFLIEMEKHADKGERLLSTAANDE